MRLVVGGSAGLLQHEDGRLVPDGAGHRRGVQPLRGLRGAARHRHPRLHRLRPLLHAAEPRQDPSSLHYTEPHLLLLQARPSWSPDPRFPASRPAATAATTSSTPSSSLPTTPFLRWRWLSSISISYNATLSKGVRLLRQQADARQPHGEGECRQPPRLRLAQPAAPRPGARGHRRGPGDRAEARQHGQVPRGGHRVPGGAVTSTYLYLWISACLPRLRCCGSTPRSWRARCGTSCSCRCAAWCCSATGPATSPQTGHTPHQPPPLDHTLLLFFVCKVLMLSFTQPAASAWV